MKCEMCGIDMDITLQLLIQGRGMFKNINKEHNFCSEYCLTEWFFGRYATGETRKVVLGPEV